jgi:hypothetical protein
MSRTRDERAGKFMPAIKETREGDAGVSHSGKLDPLPVLPLLFLFFLLPSSSSLTAQSEGAED